MSLVHPGLAPVHPDSQLQAAVVLEEEDEQPKAKQKWEAEACTVTHHLASCAGSVCQTARVDVNSTCLNEGEHLVNFPDDAF